MQHLQVKFNAINLILINTRMVCFGYSLKQYPDLISVNILRDKIIMFSCFPCFASSGGVEYFPPSWYVLWGVNIGNIKWIARKQCKLVLQSNIRTLCIWPKFGITKINKKKLFACFIPFGVVYAILRFQHTFISSPY